MGTYHPESHGARRYVLVLFPKCQGYPHLVEALYHRPSNYTVRCRPRYAYMFETTFTKAAG